MRLYWVATGRFCHSYYFRNLLFKYNIVLVDLSAT